MANSISKLSGMLLYVQVREPVDCYEVEKGKEWKASIVVEEEVADEWNEIYKKQGAKKIKRSDFKKQYKCEPPEGDEKNLYIITLKKNTHYKKDDELVEIDPQYHPRLKARKDGKVVDITDKVLAANGSLGQISVYTRQTDYGPIAQLQNILVTKLVEYKQRSEFDDDGEDTETVGVTEAEDASEEKPVKQEKPKPTTKTVAKTTKKVEKEEPEENSDAEFNDDDVPF